ncbi:hypothetical protein NA57DRAFT_76422 [Rhizodiscina lignyota]|uniref:Pre-mRNA-processing factor 39 n=1 Tax=Rhizodiscina lignyota TaxID=1504668 RepID=A0A9P4M6F1_9PEZI|nr:hypothetical protein NA57DRAFT_76422 [Rhizodiscina lignyota]
MEIEDFPRELEEDKQPSFGIDDNNAELAKLRAAVHENPDNPEPWEQLVRAAESQEGGLNRNASPQAINSFRLIYDRFLAKFPLFFGYWKRYAELEFAIAGTEAAEMVYERGVASITNSVDLWMNYCAFKVETCHDAQTIRDLFERGAKNVGLDFLAHPFWDKYIEFEERFEGHAQIFAILSRIIHIPMHQYARYFERFRNLAASRPLDELVPADTLEQYRTEVIAAGGEKSDVEMERELRVGKIDQHFLGVFSKTQAETTKRWTYEQEIKRPYFHTEDLDPAQLANWGKYLDFEEAEGDYARIIFLYERCLVTAAYYEEFWLRYARYMSKYPEKYQEVRNIYQRASCLFAPIAKPQVRIHYALFEESQKDMVQNPNEEANRVAIAQDIHESILYVLPGHIDTIISLANLARRHGGVDAAISKYMDFIDGEATGCDNATRGALVGEVARLLSKVKGNHDEARFLYKRSVGKYFGVRKFWESWLLFEIDLPAASGHDSAIKAVWDDVRQNSGLDEDTVKELGTLYMRFLVERGGPEAAKEYLRLDRELFGPASVKKEDDVKSITMADE